MINMKKLTTIAFLICAIALVSFVNKELGKRDEGNGKKKGWVSLFDGKTKKAGIFIVVKERDHLGK